MDIFIHVLVRLIHLIELCDVCVCQMVVKVAKVFFLIFLISFTNSSYVDRVWRQYWKTRRRRM